MKTTPKIRSKKQLDNLLLELASIDAQIEDLQESAEIIKLRIKEYMGDKEMVQTENFMVRWTKVLTNRFDSSLFKMRNPDLYDQYTFCNESRRFSYKEN